MTGDIKTCIELLLSSGDPDIRRRAAEDLAGTRGYTAIAALAAALRDVDKGVRDAASRALTSIGGENVARAIVEYVCDENIVTRNLAGEILHTLGSESVPALIPYLQDVSGDVRKFAVDILGLVGAAGAVTQIIPLLEDPDPNVVVSAAEALGNIGVPDCVPALFRIFEQRDDARLPVVEALGKIPYPASAEFLLRELVKRNPADDAENMLVALAIIDALGSAGNDHTFNMLLPHVSSFEGKLRRTLLHSLVRIAERSRRPLGELLQFCDGMLNCLADDDENVRASAVKVLAESHDQRVTNAFVDLLGSSSVLDPLLTEALARRPEAFALVVHALGRHEPSRAKAIITLVSRYVLASIKTIWSGDGGALDEALARKAFDEIAAAWDGADQETRAAIVDGLFRLDGDRAEEFLDAIMNDPDPWLRIHVIELIASIGGPHSPGFIARFIHDEHEMVREVAMGILDSLGFASAAVSPEGQG